MGILTGTKQERVYKINLAVQGNKGKYAPLTFVNELEAFGEDAEVILEIPFTKIVEQTGKKVPGQQTFEFEVYGFGVSGAEDKVKLTANTIETNGKGNFEGTLELTLKESDLYEHGLLSEGFFVREKNDSADGWTYSDQVWYAMPNDNMGTWMFFNVVDGGGAPGNDELYQ